jgi:hypothetical protein
VQKQVDAANRIIEDLNQPAPPPGEVPVVEPPVELVEPVEPVNLLAAEPTPIELTPPTEDAPWEHKYNVLQGKYNAEVPRLTRQVQEQDGQLSDIRQQLTNTQTILASLNQRTADPEGEVGAPATPPQRLVQDDEITAFGADLHDFIKRTAVEAVAPKLQDGISSLDQRLSRAESVAQTAQAQATRVEEIGVFDLLATDIPDWEVQNKDPLFLSWLEEVDPYTGAQRGQLLTQAFERHDGPRVVALFQGFKNENAAVTPQPTIPAPVEVTPLPEPQSLEGLVAPGTPKSGIDGGAPNDAEKRVWTQPMISQLYAQINEYTKKGKSAPDELKSLEADLIRGQSEGRVQA